MAHPRTTTISLVVTCLFVQSSLQQNCYFPNGVIDRNDYPCTSLTNNNAAPGIQVHCCEVGKTCLPNRMCSGNDQDANPMRGPCTDPTWNSANCPKFCTPYSRLGKMYNCTSTAGVLEDGAVAFCCVDTGPNCCNNQTELFVANTWDFAASAAVSAATTTTRKSTTLLTVSTLTAASDAVTSPSTTGLLSSSSPVALAPSASQSNSGMSSVVTITEDNKNHPTNTLATTSPSAAPEDRPESKRDWTSIGIGASVGAAVPLLALIAIGILLWRRHRRRRVQSGQPFSDDNVRSSDSTAAMKGSVTRSGKPDHLERYEAAEIQRYELDSVGERAELPLKSPRELPGSEGERQRYPAISHRPI